MDVEMLRMLVSKETSFPTSGVLAKVQDQAPPAHSHTRFLIFRLQAGLVNVLMIIAGARLVTGVRVTVEGWSFAPVQRWLHVRHHEASDQHEARRFACCPNVEHWLPSWVDE